MITCAGESNPGAAQKLIKWVAVSATRCRRARLVWRCDLFKPDHQ
jgi:hypothetical protein